MAALHQAAYFTIYAAVAMFFVFSVVMFIKDGIASKREGRRRKTAYTVMFVISTAVVGTAASFFVLTVVLGSLVILGM